MNLQQERMLLANETFQRHAAQAQAAQKAVQQHATQIAQGQAAQQAGYQQEPHQMSRNHRSPLALLQEHYEVSETFCVCQL